MNQFQAAGKWWADQLDDPQMDNGEPLHGMLGRMLVASTPEIEEQHKIIFAQTIAMRIEDKAEAWGENYWVSFGVDYHPDMFLASCVETLPDDVQNAILNRLPWKTNMSVRPGLVEVSMGYGAPIETVWEDK